MPPRGPFPRPLEPPHDESQPGPLPLAEVAALLGARLVGDGAKAVGGVATLEDAGPDEVAFFHNPRYRSAFERTAAGAVLVTESEATGGRLPAAALLVADNPYLAFGRLSAQFHPEPNARPGRHPSAVVEPTARVHPDAEVGPLCYVGAGAAIGARTILRAGAIVGDGAAVGEDCLLHPGAAVRDGCVIGNRVILQPGAVVGSDGFGYAFDPGGPAHVKVPQAGIARLEDDVELGANSCVDRATLGETVVGRGSKIDNLVQIAHNVRIGALGIVCAQAGISGSTELGDGVVIAGQVGVIGHLKIGDGARIGAQSGVVADVPPGETRSGSPSLPHRSWLRNSAILARLPEFVEAQRALRRRVEALERKLAEAAEDDG